MQGKSYQRVELSRVIELTSQNFDKTLRSTRKLFVDFWAPWCSPCLKMNPVVDRLADKHSSITFAKVNIDEHQDIANRYHIMSLPAYLVFTNSSPETSRIGTSSEDDLERMLDI
ncbi:MAG: thioredoxin family protein [Thaumarchaeota archaeon]|nr:thioredoxin family protein [Nitrososphaerota archaeon]